MQADSLKLLYLDNWKGCQLWFCFRTEANWLFWGAALKAVKRSHLQQTAKTAKWGKSVQIGEQGCEYGPWEEFGQKSNLELEIWG